MCLTYCGHSLGFKSYHCAIAMHKRITSHLLDRFRDDDPLKTVTSAEGLGADLLTDRCRFKHDLGYRGVAEQHLRYLGYVICHR